MTRIWDRRIDQHTRVGGEAGIITDALQRWDLLGRVGSPLQLTAPEAFILLAWKPLADRGFGDASKRINPQNQ